MIARTQAYLLAAGNGRRAGGPKAWRLHEGRPLLERQLEFMGSLWTPERIAVSIQTDWKERCQVLNPQIRWVAVDPEAPALASILALARALPLDAWTFCFHVDMRLWEPELFKDLASRLTQAETDGIEALVPACQGRRGHPVLLSPRLKNALLGLNPEKDRLDHWLMSRKAEVMEVPFPCVLDNWNLS